MVPGECRVVLGNLELNSGRHRMTLCVLNCGDRPIQIGSHFHFYEVNMALKFDRFSAWGCRLDIPSGTTVRFEPGQSRTINLVNYAGSRKVYGFSKIVMGRLDNFL